MQYRTLGRTGLSVSALSFGASSLGSVFRDVREAEGIRAVHAALDLGINYVDVSPYYGLTRAETVLGKALQDVPRDRFFLSTKAGRYGVDAFDMSSARLLRSLDESLTRLHTDYVDILLLHDVEFVPLQQILEESIPTLIELKRQGKIRFYGISGLPLTVFSRVLAHADLDVILSYCHYSLNDTTLLGLLPSLRERGVGVINASPLSMGLLTERGTPDWHLASDALKKACQRAAEYCRAQDKDLAQLAIQFAVSNPDIPTTLFSTANPDNVAKNVRWADEPVDPVWLENVLALLKPVQDQTWPSGLPEYTQT